MTTNDRYFLVSQDGEAVPISDDFLVGRGSNCDLTIEHAEVSRQHARLHASGQGIAVEDLGSSNGTYVMDDQLAGPRKLVHGDRIKFGPLCFTFIVESTDLEQTTLAGGGPAVAEAAPDVEEEGAAGTIEVMPLNHNLPPAWIDDAPAGTVLLSREDLAKISAEQVQDRLCILESEVDGPTLLLLNGSEAGRPYKLHNTAELCFWTVGRGAGEQDVSIVIDDPSVSDFHAKLVYKQGRWKILDQMSTNHTYVNGEQYNSAYLSSRDSIRFGRVNALFLLPQTPTSETPAPVPRPGLLSRLLKIGK